MKNKYYHYKKGYSNRKIIKKPESLINVYCKKFGCGKVLNESEYLYSEYCFKHQLEINKNNKNESNNL